MQTHMMMYISLKTNGRRFILLIPCVSPRMVRNPARPSTMQKTKLAETETWETMENRVSDRRRREP